MSTRSDVRSVLERHGIRLKRSLGQSFLVDDQALDQIARAATVGGEETVVEIGAGLGTLTQRLAERARRVVTIERDAALVPLLRERLPSSVSVVEGDALQLDYAAVAGAAKPAIAGNIPYSITTPLLLHILEQRDRVGLVTLMIQREVAERLTADPGGRDYGSITVLFRLHADIKSLFDVQPESFLPSPKVVSTVIQMRLLAEPRISTNPAHLERVVRAAFAQRRKTLRNSLGTAFDRASIIEAGEQTGIALERRAETLSLEEFAKLAEALPGAKSTS